MLSVSRDTEPCQGSQGRFLENLKLELRREGREDTN